jgi:hypothetical protein
MMTSAMASAPASAHASRVRIAVSRAEGSGVPCSASAAGAADVVAPDPRDRGATAPRGFAPRRYIGRGLGGKRA